MREIKFRGKRNDNGEWVYGYYSYKIESKKTFILKETINISCDSYFTEYEVIPETVGQYTGLKDKNDKEMYEGDVFKTKGGTWKVFWSDKDHAFEAELIDTIYRDEIGLEEWLNDFKSSEVEIIGNIYENGDLL